MTIRVRPQMTLYSYYPKKSGDMFDSESEMRIMVLNAEETKNFLYGNLYTAAATSGYTRNEFYDRYIPYNISNISGTKMMSLGADISESLPNYDLLTHNCDNVALDILRWGRYKWQIPKELY